MEAIAKAERGGIKICQFDFCSSMLEFGFDDFYMNVADIFFPVGTYAEVETYTVLTGNIDFAVDEVQTKIINRFYELINVMGWCLERIAAIVQDLFPADIDIEGRLCRLILRNWVGCCGYMYKLPLPVYAYSLLPPPPLS